MEQSQESTQSVARGVLTAFVVAFALVALLAATSLFFRPKSNITEYGLFDAASTGVLAEPDDSLDVLFIGDSLILNSCMPLDMWHEYGCSSYVLSTLAQKLPETNSMLRLGTRRQHPRVIVFEVQPLFAKASFDDVYSMELQRIFPVLRYHSRWRSATTADFTLTVSETDRFLHRGARVEPDIVAVDPEVASTYMTPSEAVAPIESFNSWYFARMLDYCRSIGATPMLISVPCPNNWDMERHNAVAAWAKEHGIEYRDFNLETDEIGIDWQTDSKDGGDHLNHNGAAKFSSYFAGILCTKYDLPDHRDDESYARWDKDYSVSEHYRQ